MTTLKDLKLLPQWVGWKIVPRQNKKGETIYTKLLMDARTAKAAKSNDPGTWCTAKEAWSAKSSYGWQGIGFVFTLADGIVGVDLDDCFNDNGRDIGALKPWAYHVVSCLNSYTEFSPSGNGLHIFCKGEIEASFNRHFDDEFRAQWAKSPQSFVEQLTGGLEMYDSLRYFTVTGQRFAGTPGTIEERSSELEAIRVTFAREYVPQKETKPLHVPQSDYDKPSVQQVRDMLAVLPVSGDYLWWISILAAVHDVYPDSTGVDLCEQWSSGYDGEVQKKFNSFKREGGSKATIATLIWEAKERGYKFPQKSQSVPQKRKKDGFNQAVSISMSDLL